MAVYEVLLQKAAANHCVVTCFKHSLLPAQLRQFFAQKYFSSWSGTPFVIVFPTENVGRFDLLRLLQKNGSEDWATHGPYMARDHMLPTRWCPTADHQIMMRILDQHPHHCWWNNQNVCDKSWFHRATQHRKPTLNVMWKAWGQKRLSDGERSWNLLKYALAEAFYRAARFKNSPAGCILESDNGYL